MKKANFSEAQLVAIWKEGEAGVPVAQIVRNTASARRWTPTGNRSTRGWR
jgi:hypothetical protein